MLPLLAYIIVMLFTYYILQYLMPCHAISSFFKHVVQHTTQHYAAFVHLIFNMML